jgi:hypothetical protein
VSKAGTAPACPCIRASELSLETAEALELNFSLAGIVGMSGRLKSELGFRPFRHSSERRTDARISSPASPASSSAASLGSSRRLE